MSAVAGSRRAKVALIAFTAAAALLCGIALIALWTRPVRRAVAAYTELVVAANGGDFDAARRLCSARYLATHDLVAASGGGVVGLPRSIHPNFQAWRNGADVWLCPTNRVGPVYQFVNEGGEWRFDGPVGILRGRGEFIPLSESDDALESRL
jgi:hypothetical protein